MIEPIHLEMTTESDLATLLVPTHRHSKLARSAAKFFIKKHDTGLSPVNNVVDTRTLREFVEYLISNGYN